MKKYYIFLILYYIISVIVSFIIFNYVHYKEEKYWHKDKSFFEIIDFDVFLKITIISFFSGWFYFPYTLIQLIIEKINQIIKK
jgi:hypothetical protein